MLPIYILFYLYSIFIYILQAFIKKFARWRPRCIATEIDKLLEKANVVGTPGSGFGKSGEGYFRLTAFNTKENTIEAIERIKNMM